MRILLIGSLLCLGLTNAIAEEKRYTLELSQPGQPVSLDIDMRYGSVTVEGYEGNNVEVIANFTALSEDKLQQIQQQHGHNQISHNEPAKSARSSDGLKVVNNMMVNLSIEEHQNQVEIDSEESTYHVDLTIRVPVNTSVEADLYDGGHLTMNNLKGAVELESWRGDIYANNISGPIVAETHKSTIAVTFKDFNGENPTSLTTYSGDIDITLPSDTKAQVNVQNYQGQILSGLSAEFKATESVKRNTKRSKQQIVIGGQMSAKVNGGGQDLSLITYSGNVYVREGK